jgi:hypothetical protein
VASCGLALLAGSSPPALAAPPLPSRPSALLVFAPAGERELAALPGMSVAVMSGSAGSYSAAQLPLDISQGARVSSAAYGSPVPRLALVPGPRWGRIAGWGAAARRAGSAPADLEPGLLAARLGGAGYAAVAGVTPSDASAAADRNGRLAEVSFGPAPSVAHRVQEMLAHRPLVVADLPGGSPGRAALEALAAQRGAGELLLVVEHPRRAPPGGLLWVGAAGLGASAARELTSDDTGQRGLVSDIDLAPTILAHLGLRVPSAMTGSSLRGDGPLDGADLGALAARLSVIGARRLPALAWLLAVWALIVAACAGSGRARRRALRAGALGVLWAPVVTLLPAALEPSAPLEYATIALICPALGALTDALVGWPRAPIAPAVVSVAVLADDALAGSQLLMRSLLGPDPALGSRFYGIGNDLKSGLAALALVAVAAALYPSVRSRRAALTMALCGVLLACLEGAARLGAGVGGAVLVSFGFAVATAMLLPGSRTRRRLVIVLLSPLAALLALALVDLASAGGHGHFTGSVLDARSANDLWQLLVRRYEAAWRELAHGAMPVTTALALAAGLAALRMRERLLAPVDGDPAWLAALCGTLAAGLLGSLIEDSGPVLLVVAVFTLACAGCYLWAGPRAGPVAAHARRSVRPAIRRRARATAG